jgi:hypothetical protein
LRRHQSPIIPVRVGPHAETFHVHRDILTRSEYFRKALDGAFREAEEQAIDLPEEDPAIFSFVVAFLYEGKYVPIKPIATVLGEPPMHVLPAPSRPPFGCHDPNLLIIYQLLNPTRVRERRLQTTKMARAVMTERTVVGVQAMRGKY